MNNKLPQLPVFDRFSSPHVCGHRGHSIDGHENSRAALKLAREFGASMCEIDLRLTADSQFIIFHDEILDNTSTGQGFVGAYDLAQLQTFNHRLRHQAAITGETLLSFAELLDEAQNLGLCLMIELKSVLTEPEQFLLLEQQIRDAGMTEHVIIISFDFKALKYLKDTHPLLPTLGIIHGNHLDPVMIAKEAALDVYLVDYPHFCPTAADKLHAEGVRTAQFVPPPSTFAKMGEHGQEKLAELADHIHAGRIDILGCDDVQWARTFVDRALA